eukprot:g4028.t1
MLETQVGGIKLQNCIYNASGPRSGTLEALQKIASSGAGAVLSKSATLKSQKGNPLPRVVRDVDLGPEICAGSMNSEGLPNKGIEFYVSNEVTAAVKNAAAAAGLPGKPYITSLSGLSLNDNIEMLKRAMSCEAVSAVELNLACPNVPGKPVIAYDFDQMREVLEAVSECMKSLPEKKALGVKLAPYFDMPHFRMASEIINSHSDIISFVVTTNTIGNALFVDVENEMAMIAPKGGFGGLGGGFVKHTALANVRKLRELLNPQIDLVGVGGVSSGKDAFSMILCGATAVQVGTCHWTEGAACFARISSELEEIMRKKGYSKLADFKGNLKDYEKGKPRSKARSKRRSQEASPASVPTYTWAHYMVVVLSIAIAYLIMSK